MGRPASFDPTKYSIDARRKLLDVLEVVAGKKNLVLQQSLVGPIEHLARFSTLQEHGVDRVFFLENNNTDTSQQKILFLASAEKLKYIDAVAAQIKRIQASSSINHDFSICWVPRRTLLSDRVLESAGVLGEVNVLELPMFFQSIESDVLSLELDDAFEELYLHRDPNSLFLCAKALHGMQREFGLFSRILSKGRYASQLTTLLLRMRVEDGANGPDEESWNGVPETASMSSNTLDSLVIIDRAADFASALLTQLTYEGLIDESFDISHGQVDLDPSVLGITPQKDASGQMQSKSRKYRLAGTQDNLYTSLRDANFAIVGDILSGVARKLQSSMNEGRAPDATVPELSEFVKKLPGYKAEQESLKIHTGLTEQMIKTTQSDLFGKMLEVQQNLAAGTEASTMYEMIEDFIARDVKLDIVLRLLCLASCVAGGLRARDVEHFRRLICQAYGYEHVLTLDALEKMGLFSTREGLSLPGSSFFSSNAASTNTNSNRAIAANLAGTNYNAIRKSLHLILDDVSSKNPDDIAYVFSGYAPVTVRIVQTVLQKEYLSSLGPSPLSSTAAAAARGMNISSTSNNSNQSAKVASSAESPVTFAPFTNVLSNVAGETREESQTNPSKAAQARRNLQGRSEQGKDKAKFVIVFYVGGITYAEITALRFVGEKMRQVSDLRRLVVCTTGIISGNKIMNVATRMSEGV